VSNLAAQLLVVGKHVEAEPLLWEAVEGTEAVLGPSHPDTLQAVNNLAAHLMATGRRPAVEPLLRQAMEGAECKLGPSHPSTLMVLNNLAVMLQRMQRHAEAEPLLRRAAEGSDKMFGMAHPSTLRSFNNLAMLLTEQGKHQEAKQLLERVIETSEVVRRSGRDLCTLHSLNSLKTLLQQSPRTISEGKLAPSFLHPPSILGSAFMGDVSRLGCFYCTRAVVKAAVETEGGQELMGPGIGGEVLPMGGDGLVGRLRADSLSKPNFVL